MSYRKEGSLCYVNNYLDGKEDGKFLSYNENGIITIKGNYKKGYKHGLWKFYYEDGRPATKGSFHNNYQHGQWLYLYEDKKMSRLIRRQNYDASSEWATPVTSLGEVMTLRGGLNYERKPSETW